MGRAELSILPGMGLPHTMSEAEYVALPEDLASQIEREFHLDAAILQYRLEAVLEHGVALTHPFKIAVSFEELAG